MGINRYDVVINGVHTTLQLSDDDAKARGLKPAETKPAKKAPARKARTEVANKART
jgi:hypothetical protein